MASLTRLEILLLVLDSLYVVCQDTYLVLDWEGVSLVWDVQDAVNVEGQRLVSVVAHSVAEAVGVSAVFVCDERISTGIFAVVGV